MQLKNCASKCVISDYGEKYNKMQSQSSFSLAGYSVANVRFWPKPDITCWLACSFLCSIKGLIHANDEKNRIIVVCHRDSYDY